jgi:hypothetical protein
MRGFGLAGAVATGVLLAAAGPARAIEFEPNEIVAVPPGTNAVLGYLYFNHLGEITAASPGGIPDHSAHANQFVELLRYAHWFNFATNGPLGILEVIQPFVQTFDIHTATGSQPSSSVAGPTIFIAGIWPVNDKETSTYLAFLFNLYVPTSGIDSNNRVQYDPQLAFHKGFGPNWSIDLTGDVYFYQNGDIPLGNGVTQKFSQTPSYQMQAFVNYAVTPTTVLSLGWETFLGGKQSLQGFNIDGVSVLGGPNGVKTESQRIRATASHFFTPNFQLLGELRHEFVNVGGQKQDIGVLLRALYLF